MPTPTSDVSDLNVPSLGSSSVPLPSYREHRIKDAVKHVGHHLLANESRLLVLKWPGYRFLDPWTATLHFADVYRSSFRFHFGIQTDFIAVPGTEAWTTLWSMRQSADRTGLSYADFLQIAFSMNRNNATPYERPHKRFNNPETNKTLRKKLWNARHQHAQSFLSMIPAPQYSSKEHEELPSLSAFISQAGDAASLTKNWIGLVRNFVIRYRCVDASVLILNLVSKEIREEIREQLQYEVKSPEGPRREVKTDFYSLDFRQACFGVLGAQDLTRHPCKGCPQSSACSDAGR